MKGLKKALAFVLAFSMLVQPLPAFAENVTTTEESVVVADDTSDSDLVETEVEATEESAVVVEDTTVSDSVKTEVETAEEPVVVVKEEKNNEVIPVAATSAKPADGTTTSNPFPKGTAGSNSFRIPSLVTLSDGTLVAAADARWNTTYDGGGLDTIVSRSTDNGVNWNYSFANYLGDNENVYNGKTSTCFIDPAMAVTSNDTIYMLVDLYPYGVALNGEKDTAPSTAKGFDNNGRLLLSNNNHSSYGYYLENGKIYNSKGTEQTGYTVDSHFNITGNGVNSNLFFADSPFKVVRTGFLYLTKSTDKGASWSAPTLLNLKTTSEQVCLVGPGRGLVTSSGMIVFPCYSFHGDNEPSGNTQRLSFIYSTDGTNWERTSEFNYNWASEAAVVELKDGTLRFFFRNGTTNLCYVDYSNGAWGTAVNTGIKTNSNCQISAITYSKDVDGKQVILVSCPTGPNEAGSNQSGAKYRQNGKIFVGLVNEDKTITWQTEDTIDVESKHSTNSFMYSCMTELKDGKIAILYEDQESNWGAGDNSYYQMSYATYDFPLTVDTEDPETPVVPENPDDSEDDGENPEPTIEKTENVTLEIGKSKTYTDETGAYTSGTIEDDTVASMEVKDTSTTASKELKEVSSIESGKQYLLYNIRQGNTLTATDKSPGLVMTGAATADNTNVWTIEKSGSTEKIYTVRWGKDGGYLNVQYGSASVTADAVTLQLDYLENSGYWLINDNQGYYGLNDYQGNSNNIAAGWSDAVTDSGSWWKIYEVVETVDKTSTDVTFTGLKPGTTTAVVGTTQYNITVNKAKESASVTVNGTKTFNNAGTTILNNSNSKVATATLTDGVLTVKGVAEGTATIITDYGVYTITVNDGIEVTIAENETKEISVELEEGQYVEWTTADSSYVGVAGKYDPTTKKYTNTGVIIGHEATETPVVVTGTIYNADGTKADVQKWIVKVTESEDTNTSQKHIYVNVTAIENCTVYYAVNGGELIKINGTGILADKDITGHYNIMFFADPDEGYALTYMSVSDSAKQYYTLSDGNPDGTGSGAWPFDSATQSTIPSTSGDSAWVDGHGFRWSLLEGNMSIEQMKIMFSKAIALGCDGATNFTKNANESFYTEVQFAAQKLPTVEKRIASITDGETNTTTTYTEGMKVEIGDTINYEIDIQEYAETIGPIVTNVDYDSTNTITSNNKPTYADGSYGTIEYSNETLTDPLTGDSWTPDLGTSSTTESTHSFKTKLKLTTDNFKEVVKDGIITNTVDLAYHYDTNYSTGTLKSSASAEAEITVDVPSYVVDFGLPVTLDLSELALVKGKIKSASATYGDVVVNGDTITYTPNTTLKDVDHIELDLTSGHYAIAVYPATTVYYEEGFADGVSGDWADISKATSLTQDAEEVGSKKNVYGYDNAYSTPVGASNGTSATAEKNSSSEPASVARFTFTGTGVDIYTNNTPDSGVLMAWVKNAAGKTVKAIQVDTHMENGESSYTSGQEVNAYGVPVVSLTGLERATYTVELRHIGQSVKNEDGTSSVVFNPVSLDGYRVHGTIDLGTEAYQEDGEAGPVFFELRNSVLAGLNVNAAESEYAEDIAKDTLAQVYASAEGTAGAVVLSNYAGGTTKNVQDLLDNGPKNELYLRKDEAVAFKVPLGYQVQAGMKALNETVTYSVNGSNNVVTLNTSTDMFYVIDGIANTNDGTQTITIANKGSGILSITEIKLLAQAAASDVEPAFMSLNEEDLVPALKSLGFESEKVEPEYADATLNISIKDTKGKVVATTSLTANGEVGKEATFTKADIKKAVEKAVPDNYKLKTTSFADAKVPYGEDVSVSFNVVKICKATLKVVIKDTKGKVIASKMLSAKGEEGKSVTFTAATIKKTAKEILPNGYKLKTTSFTAKKVAYGYTATTTVKAAKLYTAKLKVVVKNSKGKVLATKTLTEKGEAGKSSTFTKTEIRNAIKAMKLSNGYKVSSSKIKTVKVSYGKSKTVTYKAVK